MKKTSIQVMVVLAVAGWAGGMCCAQTAEQSESGYALQQEKTQLRKQIAREKEDIDRLVRESQLLQERIQQEIERAQLLAASPDAALVVTTQPCPDASARLDEKTKSIQEEIIKTQEELKVARQQQRRELTQKIEELKKEIAKIKQDLERRKSGEPSAAVKTAPVAQESLRVSRAQRKADEEKRAKELLAKQLAEEKEKDLKAEQEAQKRARECQAKQEAQKKAQELKAKQAAELKAKQRAEKKTKQEAAQKEKALKAQQAAER
ncbi:MAG TPA: hypothetical protein P5110_02230, partial [Candidatus Omnitrophota bacterium]|nr:hypothetical protein [Candidatus Omnitrophota bacterium]